MRYTVHIHEHLTKDITVKADSKKEALENIRRKYFNEEIVLNAENYVDTDFDCWEDPEPAQLQNAFNTVCEFCKSRENFWLTGCMEDPPSCPVQYLKDEHIEKEETT